MEISLDFPFIHGILTQEYERARDEIRSVGVRRAFENSQQRHDGRIASAPDVGRLACRAGCTWCCYFSVDVRPVEVFGILDFVERTFTTEEKARVYAEVRANSTALENLGESERMKRNVKCPFLNDVAGCQQSYEDPENLDIDPDFAPWVYQAGTAHVDAFSTAMRDAGYDVDAYELNCALDAARTEPAARERFESRLRPFTHLTGEDAPAEFDDLDP
jgi:hypothetical protein